MKIKKIKQKNYNLLNYNLFNSRTYLGFKKLSLYYLNIKYLQGFRNKFCVFELFQTKIYLKKIFKIIYEYHYFNRKILFIGFPELKLFNFTILFEKTNHYSIPYNTWITNIIMNKSQIFQHLKLKVLNSKTNKQKLSNLRYLNKISKIKEIPDLIVIYNNQIESLALKEVISVNIPVITFLNSSNKSKNILYKIPGNFQDKNSNKFYYLLLKSVLTLPKLKNSTKFFKKVYKK